MADELEKTPLFLAATRPATVRYVGLPMGVVFGLIVGYGLILGILPNWGARGLALIGLFTVAVAIGMLVRYDHNIPRILLLWFQTKCRSFDSHRWGGSAIEPYPLAARPTGVPIDVR